MTLPMWLFCIAIVALIFDAATNILLVRQIKSHAAETVKVAILLQRLKIPPTPIGEGKANSLE